MEPGPREEAGPATTPGCSLLQAGLIGAFLSFDVVLFYVFFELTLVPLFFLIGAGAWAAARRDAARKFFLYTLAGSLLTLRRHRGRRPGRADLDRAACPGRSRSRSPRWPSVQKFADGKAAERRNQQAILRSPASTPEDRARADMKIADIDRT